MIATSAACLGLSDGAPMFDNQVRSQPAGHPRSAFIRAPYTFSELGDIGHLKWSVSASERPRDDKAGICHVIILNTADTGSG